MLTPPQWNCLAGVFAGQTIFAAKLLCGEMPQDIEEAFANIGMSLFPNKPGDLQTNCSCPDWSNPCKHIAAVYYLLGEEFDRDSFLIFKLRGITREELIEMMNAISGEEVPYKKPGKGFESVIQESSSVPEPLNPEAAGFWEGGSLPNDLFGAVNIPRAAAALPKRLGNFPFWRGDIPLIEAIETVYSQASRLGLEAFLGEIPPSASGC